MANNILLNTGLNQSLVSGNARATITDIAYSIYDLEISVSTGCDTTFHVAITFRSSSLMEYDKNIKFHKTKNFKTKALSFCLWIYRLIYSKKQQKFNVFPLSAVDKKIK